MKLKGIYTAMTAFALVAAPTMASATPIATPLTQPAPEAVDGDNSLHGGLGGGGFVIAILAVAAIVAGIIVVVDNKDHPNSP